MTARLVMGQGLPWLSVLTTPERPQYLEATIAAIDGAGAGGRGFMGKKWIVVDGDPAALWPGPVGPPYLAEWSHGPAHSDFKARGSARALVEILQAAARADATYLLYFEDDLQLCRDAVRVMQRIEVPSDCWALQFCDLKHLGEPLPVDLLRIHRHATDHHWGTQALKIPAWTLQRSLTSPAPAMWWQKTSSDVLLGKIATSPTTPNLGVVSPSLVQHVGAISLCNPDRQLREWGRSAHNFPGVDFDAGALRGRE